MLSKTEIAKKRIEKLFKLAEEELKKGNLERTKRYIYLARKIGMKCQYTLPRELKRKFCKKCNMMLIPGISCEVKLNKKTKTKDIKCFNCNYIRRYPYGEQNRRKFNKTRRKTEK
ncbi:MAG TPA: ribonuclease P [Candidatus Aenigmarchaeota archaeon]|nr:MAG: ribonuclease P [Candidatus Aenigmarchaeota archaeon]HDI06643.1 ribonuclease P [Candidatus Aenigmarchaeota archaeon]